MVGSDDRSVLARFANWKRTTLVSSSRAIPSHPWSRVWSVCDIAVVVRKEVSWLARLGLTSRTASYGPGTY